MSNYSLFLIKLKLNLMKKLFCLILLSFCSISVWSQNDISKKTIKVTYLKAFKNYKDISDTEPKLMKNLEYQLLCNTNEALFEYIPSMSIDGDHTNKRFIGRGGGGGVYYRNLKEKENLHQTRNINENLYIITEDLNKYNWQLFKETKKILGYDCFKAVAELKSYSYLREKEITLKITVWYTPNIPVPFGPAGYDGLPGLVLESSTSSFYLIANTLEFQDKILEIKKPKKGKIITNDEFIKISKKVIDKFENK